MGCVNSKVVTRTGCFSEELSRSLERRNRSFPALQKLLISRSKKGGDPFLVIYNADDTSLESSTDNIKQTGDKHINPETIDTWDLMKGLDEPSQLQEEEEIEDEEGQGEHVHHERKQQFTSRSVHGSADTTKQSQSFRLSFSDHKSSLVMNGHGVSSADIGVRSKSFHTVDEYDAIIMERNKLSTIKLKKDWEDGLADYLKNVNKVLNPYSFSVVTPKSICDEVEEQGKIGLEMRSKTCVERDTEDSRHLAPAAYIPENIGVSSNVSTCTSGGIESTEGKAIEDHEKGVRRKAWAKDLTWLAIPSTIEFPVIATEDYQGNVLHPHPSLDQNYYVTPKFGSFGLPLSFKKVHISEDEIQDASVFDPEMLSALEVAMLQLQREEDLLLKQMGNILDENNYYELPPDIQG